MFDFNDENLLGVTFNLKSNVRLILLEGRTTGLVTASVGASSEIGMSYFWKIEKQRSRASAASPSPKRRT